MQRIVSFRQSAPVRQSAQLSRPVQRSVRVMAKKLDLDPDNTNILVCGGGGVAFETVKLLKDMGSWVWMMQRTQVRKSVSMLNNLM